jgi:diguanylate cyclase (GGDEF)-like protein
MPDIPDHPPALARPDYKGTALRPVVVLVGDPQFRPDGLERDMVRAGFQVAEAGGPGSIPGRPALVVVTCASLSPDCEDLAAGIAAARPSGAQVVALLPGGTPDDLIRAAEAGVDEAILLPAEAPQLIARLRARVVSPRVAAFGPAGNDLRLFEVLQAVATELHREDMLHALVQGIAHTAELQSVSCLLHTTESTTGRLVAASDAPKVRDEETSLGRWPEAVASMRAGETIYLRNVGVDPIFTSLASRSGMHAPPLDLDSVAAIPLAPLGRPIGTVVLRTREGEPALQPGQVAFAELAVTAAARLIETHERRGAIARRQAIAAHVDPLTGCGTLDSLDRRLREEFERARRYDVTFAVVLIDIDGMQQINERLGRDGGHRVLADFGRLLQRELRAPDFVARYGGEEFLLVLPETDAAGGRDTVHRIRDRLSTAGLDEGHLGTRFRLTAGVATFPHVGVHKPEDLFALVESALLDGKSQDVDRVGIAA